MTKFTIIIPMYNVEVYLNQCLDSIVNQSFSDFEVICINDGSTDNSLDILNSYASKDKRFRIFSQENQGQGVARNKALELAQGKYVIFVDPDDWIEHDTLDEIYWEFKTTKSDVIEFNYNEHNDLSIKKYNFAKKLRKYFNYDLNSTTYYNWQNIKNGCLSKLGFHIWSRAYSLEFIKKADAVFSPTKQGEDHLFSNAVVLNAEKISYLDKYLYNYRRREGSAVSKISNEGFAIFQNIQDMKEYLITHNFYDTLEDEFRRYKTKVLCWHYKNIPDESKEKYKQMCQEILKQKEYAKFLRKTGNSFLQRLKIVFGPHTKKSHSFRRTATRLGEEV